MKKIYLEQLFEIRFKPHSKVLDKRGEITSSLTNDFLNKWTITNNSIELKSELNDRVKAFFGFKNMGFVSNYPTAKKDFLTYAREHIRKSWTFTPFDEIVRIGVRGKIVIPTDSFKNCFNAFRDKFYRLEDKTIEGFGGTLVDLSLPLNFSEDLNQFNITSGPVQSNEIKNYFKDDMDNIPKYGVYVETDYFTTEISTRIKQKSVLDFLEKGVEKADSVTEHIFSTLEI